MIRPPLEVADIVRTYGTTFVKQHRRWLTALHLKVLRAIVACRTAALGGHIEQCDSCGQRAISYNSCLNRHCPKCQAAARQRWLEKRSAELLPVPYYHVVFTLPTFWLPWPCRIKFCCTACCFAPQLRLSSRSPLIPNTWVPTSAFWQFCIPGARLCALIPTCIVWSREEDSPPIIAAGSPVEVSSFCQSKCSVWCFEESSCPVSSKLLSNTSSLWLAN